MTSKIRKLGGYPAAQTSVEAPAVQAALSVFLKYADEVSVKTAGSGQCTVLPVYGAPGIAPGADRNGLSARAHTRRTRSC